MRCAIAALSLLLFLAATPCICHGSDPAPAPWPEQFHAVLYMNLTDTGKLVVNDLWYDWPNGRNFNIMQKQLEEVLYDLEWNNGTSYYYTLGDDGETCRTMEFGVGIPRPDWLSTSGGANYLGQVYVDGFLCNAWEKLQFIWYYEDVVSRRPVRWDFFDGISNHVMTFEVGAVLEDSRWQAPSYCFGPNIEYHQVPSATRRMAWISAANHSSI